MECNAKLNKKDQFGNTPLIQACLKGHEETVSMLMQVPLAFHSICTMHVVYVLYMYCLIKSCNQTSIEAALGQRVKWD